MQSNKYHKVLERQLRKVFGKGNDIPENILPLLELVSQTYEQHEQEKDLLNNTMDVGMRELTVLNTDLISQKETVEKLLRDIRSSINYALRIQNAILPKESEIKKHFDCFVFFRPKDVVSGDFYFFANKRNLQIIAVADCTGHGVSGAFMTMIANNILNQLIHDYGIYEPNQILNKISVLLGKVLRHTKNNEVKDGVDIAIITLYQKNNIIEKIEYAGAKNSLYYIQNQELKELKADRNAIYSKKQEDFQYRKQEIDIDLSKKQHNFITLYLCTDGFQDQFGGLDRRKFMLGNFKKLLLEISDKSMIEQEKVLLKTFEGWKGIQKQTDDIAIVGIRF